MKKVWVAWAVNRLFFGSLTTCSQRNLFRAPSTASCPGHLSVTYMLPLVQDEGPIPQEELEWERLGVRPGRRVLPRHLQPPRVIGHGFGHHALRRVRLYWKRRKWLVNLSCGILPYTPAWALCHVLSKGSNQHTEHPFPELIRCKSPFLIQVSGTAVQAQNNNHQGDASAGDRKKLARTESIPPPQGYLGQCKQSAKPKSCNFLAPPDSCESDPLSNPRTSQ